SFPREPVVQAGVGGAWTPDPWPTVAQPAPPRGLREPPPGTLPEAEKAFRELPASPADLPPVGGIGRSGIHVDRISTGAEYDRGHCQQSKDSYSISAGERVNVCIRVVHPREKEDVVIHWEKDGGTMRRSQIPIVPMHAYRTRAYLALRQEYVGQWTVRVHSTDGVELAQESFSVVEWGMVRLAWWILGWALQVSETPPAPATWRFRDAEKPVKVVVLAGSIGAFSKSYAGVLQDMCSEI